jgi:hypothetical protein
MARVRNEAAFSELVLLGAFPLEAELDAESLHYNGYAAAQQSLAAYLNSPGDRTGKEERPSWIYNNLNEQAVLFAPPDFPNRQILPMAFLRFESEEITAELSRHLTADTGHAWHIASCSLNFFTSGFASIRLDLRHSRINTDAVEVSVIEEFSHHLAERLADAVKPVRLEYEKAVRTVLPQLVIPALISKEHHHAGVLWLHRILIWRADDLRAMAENAEAVVPNVHETLIFRDVAIVAGVDTSVICNKIDHIEPPDWIIRIFEFTDVVYAYMLQLDAYLFDELNRVVFSSRTAGSFEAAEAARGAQSISERVSLYRANVDTTVGSLGSASIAIWRARWQMAGTPHLDASLSRKLELLGRLAQSRNEAAELAHARRLNRLALIFTLFSVASSGTALIDFAYGGAWLSTSESRIFVLFGLFLAVIVATLLTIREVRLSAESSHQAQ